MKLMIVESPNKVRKIRTILGSGWDVAASVGHIRDLPVKDLGLTMPGYVPQYELSGRGADVAKTLKARAAKADEVYLATDPDREGEAIAWHVAQVLRLKKPHRVAFDAITPEVIRRALAAPRTIDISLVHAQEARRVLDRLVGYQVSPQLSRQTGQKGLSAGRVQSPAVRLVVEREREIEAFRETRHFGAELLFDDNAWRAQWETKPFLKKDQPPYILDEALAKRAAACRACVVLDSANKLQKQPPPPPFTTSTMLQAASVRLKWKPEITAQVAQRLFEAGLITYHRTDSQNFSAEALTEVRDYASQRKLPLPAKPRTFRSKGNAQEAHEAIRPTHFASEHAGEDGQQQALYRLIWERAVASQLADAEWSVNTTRLESTHPETKEVFTYKAEGRVLVAPGWRALTAKDETEEDEPTRDGENCGRVPVLAKGAAVNAHDGRVLNKKTQPPPRYTEASLIKKLESIGIGRPSTYPAILKNILTRNYLEIEKRFLRPTPTGCLVVDTLAPRFSFLDYAFTRDLESQLDAIAEGKAQYLEVVSAADTRLQSELAGLSKIARPQPYASSASAARATGTPFDKQTGASRGESDGVATDPRFGSAGVPPWRRHTAGSAGIANFAAQAAPNEHARELDAEIPAEFWKAEESRKAAAGASSRTKSSNTPAASAKRKRTRKSDISKEPSSPKTSARKATRTKGAKTRDSNNTEATQPEAKGTRAAQKAEAAFLCPHCKQGTLRLASENAKFYGCSAFPETGCRFVVWRTIAGRTITAKEVSTLCTQGRTEKLSGFTSKAGRPFEAALAVTPEGRVEFSFSPRP